MSTKTREELRAEYRERICLSASGDKWEALVYILAELADQRQPEAPSVQVTSTTTVNGAPFVPASVEATPPGECVTTELDKLIGGCPDWMRMSGIACYDVRTAAKLDQLEAVRRAREADAKTIVELRQTIARVVEARNSLLDEAIDLRQQVERLTAAFNIVTDNGQCRRTYGNGCTDCPDAPKEWAPTPKQWCRVCQAKAILLGLDAGVGK